MKQPRLIPLRFIRLRDAPHYLGMDKRLFNTLVRPYISEVPIEKQGIGFDIPQLNAWADKYFEQHARPPKKVINEEMAIKKPVATQPAKHNKKPLPHSLDDEFEKLLGTIYKKHGKTKRNTVS